ncbi:MAG TPA: Hsp20/alpha crystallin family protein [Candidatus Binatia bacterium]|jgi:HSP20 family protein|nr:Hsp20/alpha crystallin family protein [Candidatus Binatia bacterium]
MAPIIPLRKNPDENEDEMLLFPEAPHLAAVRTEEAPAEDRWFEQHEEGRLAVDVLENDKELIITSAIAGVKPENLEVFVHNDMLTIRGKRHADTTTEAGAKYLVRECHWGSFSRSVILPMEVDVDAIAATIKDGVLMVRMPKTHRSKRIAVQGR